MSARARDQRREVMTDHPPPLLLNAEPQLSCSCWRTPQPLLPWQSPPVAHLRTYHVSRAVAASLAKYGTHPVSSRSGIVQPRVDVCQHAGRKRGAGDVTYHRGCEGWPGWVLGRSCPRRCRSRPGSASQRRLPREPAMYYPDGEKPSAKALGRQDRWSTYAQPSGMCRTSQLYAGM